MTHPFHAIPPRLLDVVELAQPLATLEPQIYAWASESGTSVYTQSQLRRLKDLAHGFRDQAGVEGFATDLYLALGALTAQERRPADGWMGYVRHWELKRLQVRLSSGDKTDFTRLRELEIQVGGILLNDPSCPLVLLIPQPDGNWIQAGWELLIELAGSPFGPNRHQLPILRQHVVPLDLVVQATSPKDCVAVPA